ncbi:MAG TPA: c-type cytochrome [Candidatus Acidoferrales bacterium]|jgi:mono/diheme cytochrome c family protein|nr:c-type cytochrome [Candidatus Acidoferrales bacterium]
MKKHIALASIAAAGLACLVSGCASTSPLAVQQAALPKDKVDAPALFVENCATCHGKDGRAHTFHGRLVFAQNLTDTHWHATDAEIIDAIKTGPRVMPAFEKKLSGAEIEALGAYVRTFKPAR